MRINISVKEHADDKWNDRLLNNEFGTIHQTKEYGEFRRNIWGQDVNYVTFFDNQKVIGQMTLFKFSRVDRKINQKLGKNISKRLEKFTKKFKPMYSWYFGPVIFDHGFSDEIYSEIANFPSKFNAPFVGSLHPLENARSEFPNSGWNTTKKGTFLIDLTLSEKELWENIENRSGRKAVNRALKKNIEIKPITSLDEVKIHHKLLNEGREIANLQPISLDRITSHWKMLSGVGEKGFIAWLEDLPLASTFVTTFNGYVNEQGFSRSKYDKENLMNATDLIKWHIIKWAKESGYRIFDLSGVELDPNDQKLRGIFKFKEKWGGEFQDWYHYRFNP